jgi:mRNA-degrading endonuclease RelE of RelBE toxin-antitoxin system
VSASEIIAELPKLSRTERRQLAAAIFELEEEVDLLRDSDRRADERFRMLDAMEEEDGQTGSRCPVW